MQHRNRACFEFLVARQWGRKTAVNFSLPLIMFCRVLKWTEKAKKAALLIHGTNKSTLRGVPRKKGALVGLSDLVVDGYGTKPANSLSFNEINQQSFTPSNCAISVLMSAKSQSREISRISKLQKLNSSFSKNSATISFNSSVSSLFGSSVSTNSKHSIVARKNEELLRNGKTLIANNREKSLKIANQDKSETVVKLPNITIQRSLVLKQNSKSIFVPSFEIDTTISEFENKKSRKGSIWPSKNLYNHPIMDFKRESITDPGFPLPARSNETRKRPLFYWSTQGTGPCPVKETLLEYQKYRGMGSRQHAIKCVALSSSFTEKPWLQQIKMAASLSKRGVKKVQTVV